MKLLYAIGLLALLMFSAKAEEMKPGRADYAAKNMDDALEKLSHAIEKPDAPDEKANDTGKHDAPVEKANDTGKRMFKDEDVKRVLVGSHRLFTVYDAICQRFALSNQTLGRMCFLARYNVVGFYIDSKHEDLGFLDMKVDLLQEELIAQVFAIFPELDSKFSRNDPTLEQVLEVRKQREKDPKNWPLPKKVEEDYFGISFIPYNGRQTTTYTRWPVLFEQLMSLLDKSTDKSNAAA